MTDGAVDILDELQVVVWRNRYLEARQAGLEHMDAIRFARSEADIGQLRQLVKDGCTPRLIVRIVL